MKDSVICGSKERTISMAKNNNSLSIGKCKWTSNEPFDSGEISAKNINDVDREAKKHGMSYGHYVAYLYSKQQVHT